MKISIKFDKRCVEDTKRGCTNPMELYAYANMIIQYGLGYQFANGYSHTVSPKSTVRVKGVLNEIMKFDPMNLKAVELQIVLASSTRVTVYIYYSNDKGIKHSCQICFFRKGSKVAFYEIHLQMSPLEITNGHGMNDPVYELNSLIKRSE